MMLTGIRKFVYLTEKMIKADLDYDRQKDSIKTQLELGVRFFDMVSCTLFLLTKRNQLNDQKP
jgi:hypothetical protein